MNDQTARIPQPGDLLGWVILFGPRMEYRAFVPAGDGRTVALAKAAQVHGVVVAAMAAGAVATAQ